MITKYSKVHRYPDAYDDVVKTLRRLEKDGEAKCLKASTEWSANLWCLPGTKPPSPEFRDHELDIMDIYKAYWPFYPNELQYWDWKWQDDEIKEYKIHKRDSLLFDSRMQFRGTWFFWEVNRGTKSHDALLDQVKGYFDFAKAYPYIKFHVIWTLQAKRRSVDLSPEEQKRIVSRDASLLLDRFEDYGRGNQFLVAKHQEVLTNPKGNVLVSALDPAKPISILNLTPL